MLYTIFLILGVLAISGEISLIAAWMYAPKLYKKQKPEYYQKTRVIVPCKGVEKNFKENIQAICDQDYNQYEIVFVTDSKDDPAYNFLKKELADNPKTRIEISDLIEGCSGKISALIKGVKASGDVDVYVFADSDIKPHRDWLRLMVLHLKLDGIGATSGYRWYFPHDVKSLLVSTWNMAGIPSLFYPPFSYAWGGSTAITKTVFEELNIESKWRTGLSDDLILTRALKKAGYKIRFVPQCVVESPAYEDIRSFFKWSTRQFTWVRWYFPRVWAFSLVGSLWLKFLTCLGFLILIFGFTLPGLLMISTIFFEMIYGSQGFITMRKLMWYPRDRFGKAFSYALMMPVVSFILAYNNIVSSFKREIRWGGKIYRKDMRFPP